MAKKGNARHMKSLNAPNFFAVHRKEHVYVAKPRPGRHTLKSSLPISLLLEKLELARSAAESRRLLMNKGVMVRGRMVTDRKYAVGIGDIVELPLDGKRYRIEVDSLGHAKPVQLDEKSPNVYKVLGKYRGKGDKLMLRLTDGSVAAGSAEAHVNDSVVLEDGKVKELIKMDRGVMCMVIAGRHAGARGTVKELVKGSMKRAASATIDGTDGSKFETLVRNIMATR